MGAVKDMLLAGYEDGEYDGSNGSDFSPLHAFELSGYSAGYSVYVHGYARGYDNGTFKRRSAQIKGLIASEWIWRRAS